MCILFEGLCMRIFGTLPRPGEDYEHHSRFTKISIDYVQAAVPAFPRRPTWNGLNRADPYLQASPDTSASRVPSRTMAVMTPAVPTSWPVLTTALGLYQAVLREA